MELGRQLGKLGLFVRKKWQYGLPIRILVGPLPDPFFNPASWNDIKIGCLRWDAVWWHSDLISIEPNCCRNKGHISSVDNAVLELTRPTNGKPADRIISSFVFISMAGQFSDWRCRWRVRFRRDGWWHVMLPYRYDSRYPRPIPYYEVQLRTSIFRVVRSGTIYATSDLVQHPVW